MPCNICNSLFIYYNNYTVCYCNTNVVIVPYDDSINIIQHHIAKNKIQFENHIRTYKKNELIKGVFWTREKYIRKFMEIYSAIEVDKLASTSNLLRRLFVMNEFSEEKHVDNNTIQSIIAEYTKILDMEDGKIKLEAKTFNMISSVVYDRNNLESIQLKNIGLFANENYVRLINTFGRHGIMSEEKARAKIQEEKQNIRLVRAGSNRISSVKKTIEKFYDLISSLYSFFCKNKLYQETFSFPMENIEINPIDIKKFNAKYPMIEKPTEINFLLFKNDLLRMFKEKFDEVIVNFVLSDDNRDAFPLFIKIEDKIIISQAFGELYCYFLHAIVNKKEFDKETEKRSKIFEQKIVKRYFEELGFRYYKNVPIPNMEIDGIAISDDIVYVIEVKGWGLRKLLEEKTSAEFLVREIKSAITGIRHNAISGKIKRRRPIKDKVMWVSNNKELFHIKKTAIVAGLLVINEQPIISEYLNCKIINVDDMSNP